MHASREPLQRALCCIQCREQLRVRRVRRRPGALCARRVAHARAPVAGTTPLPVGDGFSAHCTAPCRAAARPAWRWREAWEAQLARFVEEHPEGREWRATMAFVTPHKKDDFIWNVY